MAYTQEPERFDPRKHASVFINVNEKVPDSTGISKSGEYPVKTLIVGPHDVQKRPSTAPATGRKTVAVDPMSPRFLDKHGRWVQAELPEPVLNTQAQPVTATQTITAAVNSTAGPRSMRPVSAVHSYGDVSPVITAEHVRSAAPGGGTIMLHTFSPTGRTSAGQSPRSPTGRAAGSNPASPRSPGSNGTGNGYYSIPGGESVLLQAPPHAQQQQQAAPGQLTTQRSQSAGRKPSWSNIYGDTWYNASSQLKHKATARMSGNGKVSAGTYRSPYAQSTMRSSSTGRVPSAKPAAASPTGRAPSAKPAGASPKAAGGKGAYITEMYGNAQAGHPEASQTVNGNASGAAVGSIKVTTANGSGPFASAATNAYWQLPQEGTNLGTKDLTRILDLGKNTVPGSANCRLIGGRWRYVPRPVEGDVVYTDFYGPYGNDRANYYGRSYNVNTAEFSQNRLVDDNSYQRVRASMMGIQTLRDRPGLALDTTIVHGPTDKLHEFTSASAAQMAHMHNIQEYHNLRPSTQTAWA